MRTRAGCEATDTILVEIAPSPVFSFGADTSLCTGDRFVLSSPITAEEYTWNTGSKSASITIQSAGRYYLTARNGSCSFTDTVQVASLATPSLSLGLDQLLCPAEQIQLTPDIQSYPLYQWSNGATSSSIQINSPGWYWVEAANADGCRFRDSVLIQAASALAVNLGADQESCEPAAIALSAPVGADSYSWSTGESSRSITVNQSGNYFVHAFKDGCRYSDTVSILLKPLPSLTVSADLSICENETAELVVTSNTPDLSWSTGEVGSRIEVRQPGIYAVTAVLNGCSIQESVVVSRQSLPQVSLGEDQAICDGEALRITPVIREGDFLQWTDGFTQPERTIQAAGTYILAAQNRCGISTDTVLVKPGSEKANLYQVANAFSPNGDGKNDCFGIQNWLIKDIKEFSIYNRFGQLIFSGNNNNRCWNGYFNGKMQESGGYVYVLRVETNCGFIDRKGIFLLIK